MDTDVGAVAQHAEQPLPYMRLVMGRRVAELARAMERVDQHDDSRRLLVVLGGNARPYLGIDPLDDVA